MEIVVSIGQGTLEVGAEVPTLTFVPDAGPLDSPNPSVLVLKSPTSFDEEVTVTVTVVVMVKVVVDSSVECNCVSDLGSDVAPDETGGDEVTVGSALFNDGSVVVDQGGSPPPFDTWLVLDGADENNASGVPATAQLEEALSLRSITTVVPGSSLPKNSNVASREAARGA